MEISETRKKDFRTFFAAGYIKTKEKPTTHPLLRKKNQLNYVIIYTSSTILQPKYKIQHQKTLQKQRNLLNQFAKWVQNSTFYSGRIW